MPWTSRRARDTRSIRRRAIPYTLHVATVTRRTTIARFAWRAAWTVTVSKRVQRDGAIALRLRSRRGWFRIVRYFPPARRARPSPWTCAASDPGDINDSGPHWLARRSILSPFWQRGNVPDLATCSILSPARTHSHVAKSVRRHQTMLERASLAAAALSMGTMWPAPSMA